MAESNLPPPPATRDGQAPGFQLPPPRKYKCHVVLENNQTGEIAIESRDHIGALVKLAAYLNDAVPIRVLKINLIDQTDQTIITPGFRR